MQEVSSPGRRAGAEQRACSRQERAERCRASSAALGGGAAAEREAASALAASCSSSSGTLQRGRLPLQLRGSGALPRSLAWRSQAPLSGPPRGRAGSGAAQQQGQRCSAEPSCPRLRAAAAPQQPLPRGELRRSEPPPAAGARARPAPRSRGTQLARGSFGCGQGGGGFGCSQASEPASSGRQSARS